MALYLCSVLHDTNDSATGEEMAAIDAFNEQLRADGHWVFAGGLASPSTATVVDGREGEALFTDGPYLESKEYIAGFCRSEESRAAYHRAIGLAGNTAETAYLIRRRDQLASV